ncbi:MAG: hypothetical protein J5725_03630, partial [Bacteroidales bacterium]|nr:hypothetical protein [Bacteroidales bacterium]
MAVEIKLRETDRKTDAQIVKKTKRGTKNTAKTVRSMNTLETKISSMREIVEKYLGSRRDNYLLIAHSLSLMTYAMRCIENGVCAIDTETTSLDVFTCDLVGFSLYTPGEKPCYVPVNHVNYMTGEKEENQLSYEQVARALRFLKNHDVKFIFFNADFDVRVFRHTVDVDLPVYFDCYIAARLLNENEPNNGLKALHKKYVSEEDDEFSYTQLFEKVPFNLIPINTAYLYGANDALLTYELYEFQLPYLTPGTYECEEQELEGVQYVFWNIEMPIVSIMADIEDRGVSFDFEYQKVLSEKYNALQKAAEEKFYADLKKYTENWYSISSPKQLSELFYYDLGVLSPIVDSKTGKVSTPTDIEALSSIDHELAKDILEYRKNAKLISTYIDKMAKVAERDGRVHCLFNQVGTDTGRFSSKDPNLQNIPSHNMEIRRMFKASEGCVLIGADFSAQEVRMVAHLCGDPKMIQAYKDGKDLYCEIASLAFQVPYEECMEFRPDGTLN